MTTAPDIDPRLVCVACGWGVGRDSLPGGFDHVRGGPAANEYLDELCDGAAYMSAVMQALEPLTPELTYSRRDEVWAARAWRTGEFVICETPHEAIYALATAIGRHLEQSS